MLKKTILLLIALPLILFSQQKRVYGTLEGRVLDETNSPLIGANIRIENTLIGAATNHKGIFRIIRVPVGKHQVKFSMVGYESKTIEVEIKQDETTFIEVKLNQTAIQTKEVFVSASKYEQKIEEIPVSISALSSQELSFRNTRRLDEALKYVPGINMTSDQISIRGSSGYTRGAGSRVLLLIDGIPLHTGDAGDIIWQLLPIHEIERVEVVKAAGSALYGSQAIGGVINIITKDFSSRPTTYIKTQGGFYDKPFYDEWNWSSRTRYFNTLTLSHSRKIGDLGLTISASRFEDDSYRMNNFSKRYSLFFKTKYNINPTNNVSLLFNGTTYRSGSYLYWKDSRNALVPPDGQIGQWVKTERFNVNLSYQNLYSASTLINFKNSWFHNDWWDNTDSKNSSRSDLIRSEISFNHFTESHKIVGGIEGTFATVTSNIFSNPNAYSLSLFGQDELSLFNDKIKFTAGLRIDYQNIDTVLSEFNYNPKFATNIKFSENIFVRASLGRGYRAPTPSELFSTTSVSGIRVVPNPNLKSESNWNFETGINYTFSEKFKVDAAIFGNELYNFIEPSIDPITSFIQFKNITRARILGYEITFNSELFDKHLRTNLGYTYLWARDLKNNIFLKYRPRHLVMANVVYRYDFIQTGIDFRFWNRLETIDEDLILLGIVKDGDLREHVFLTDFHLSLDLISFKLPLRFYFTINNLFNYNYIEMIGNLGAIRSFSFTLEGLL
ncbi:MAG: TonB-dependent receptor [Ignavibacteria bacterium]|nr:TonB-dependent receptor [Ignavibacteria bacterium]